MDFNWIFTFQEVNLVTEDQSQVMMHPGAQFHLHQPKRTWKMDTGMKIFILLLQINIYPKPILEVTFTGPKPNLEPNLDLMNEQKRQKTVKSKILFAKELGVSNCLKVYTRYKISGGNYTRKLD